MAQHFLLSAQARTLSLVQVARMSQEQAEATELMIFLPHDKGDRPSLTGRIEIPDMPTPPTTPELLDVDQSYMFNGRIVVSPLEIREEGYIRVRANFDGEIVKIGALRLVRQVSTGT
jgi:hypothetical protein